jgi:mono/diheme cytochrome c family protein
MVSILGPRGSKSTKPPLEVFSDMDRMPKYHPQAESSFFADGRTDRLPVDGSIARGTYIADEYLATGKRGGTFGSGFPTDVDNAAMARGEDRYNIYCAVCHGGAGDGDGMTKQYGMLTVANLTDTRLSGYTDGQIYDVVKNGKGLMYGYADRLSVEDRWNVVLYVRALQRAANGSAKDLTPAKKEELGL